MEKGLLEKTGMPLNEWIAIVRKENLEKHSAIISFLKSVHGFSHGFANFVALKAREANTGSYDSDEIVAMQYSKGKEHLKHIYDQLIEVVNSLGSPREISRNMHSVISKLRRCPRILTARSKVNSAICLVTNPDHRKLLKAG